MFNNFHEIKAIISNTQGFKASFFGMAEYIQGMMSNRIKFKNLAVESNFVFAAMLKESSVKIENSKLYTTLLSALKPKENVIKFTDEIKVRLISIVKPKDSSKITFLDKPIQKLNILFNPTINKNDFKFENNEPNINVALQGRTDKNDVLIDNNNQDGTHTTVTLAPKTDKNDVSFQNSLVNASAWRMMRVGDMKGTVRSYAGLTVGETGRKKIT